MVYYLKKSRSFPKPISTIKTSILKLKWTQFSFNSKDNIDFMEIILQSQSHLATEVSQSVCLGVEPLLGLIYLFIYLFLFILYLYSFIYLSESCCPVNMGCPLWQEVGSVACHSVIVSHLSVYTWYSIYKVIKNIYIQYLQGVCQSRLSTADYALRLAGVTVTYPRSYVTGSNDAILGKVGWTTAVSLVGAH
jgi:hypothetical protein